MEEKRLIRTDELRFGFRIRNRRRDRSCPIAGATDSRKLMPKKTIEKSDAASFLQRAAGKSIRADKAGIMLIGQGTAA